MFPKAALCWVSGWSLWWTSSVFICQSCAVPQRLRMTVSPPGHSVVALTQPGSMSCTSPVPSIYTSVPDWKTFGSLDSLYCSTSLTWVTLTLYSDCSWGALVCSWDAVWVNLALYFFGRLWPVSSSLGNSLPSAQKNLIITVVYNLHVIEYDSKGIRLLNWCSCYFTVSVGLTRIKCFNNFSVISLYKKFSHHIHTVASETVPFNKT